MPDNVCFDFVFDDFGTDGPGRRAGGTKTHARKKGIARDFETKL